MMFGILPVGSYKGRGVVWGLMSSKFFGDSGFISCLTQYDVLYNSTANQM